MESKKYICDCKKEYKTQSGLSKHKNKCSSVSIKSKPKVKSVVQKPIDNVNNSISADNSNGIKNGGIKNGGIINGGNNDNQKSSISDNESNDNEKPNTIEEVSKYLCKILDNHIDNNGVLDISDDDDDDDFELDSECEKLMPDIYKIIICKLLEQNKELKEIVIKLNNKIFELSNQSVVEKS